MININAIKIDKDIEKDFFNKLLSYVSVEKKERITRFYNYKDAQRTLLGDILARYSICKRSGLKINDLHFGANEYGKPTLSTSTNIHFNISHSGNWVICAIDDNPVGVDVEVIKPIDLSISERFFTTDENCSLFNQPVNTRLEYFYKIWTLKESYIKAEGKGLSIPLNNFNIRIDNEKIKLFTEYETKQYIFHQSFLDENSIYAVCSTNNAIECNSLNIDQFKDKLNNLLKTNNSIPLW